ncbi:Rieske (2Fe-2S) protein [Pseudonocardia sp. NPDC049154]|uniref:Rieske (2Fe-2S) protein n=1 Tax=Pseudonocardia sp. NPDC049154 TaxID=3155501 RepID=UPI0033F01371
MTGSGRRIVVAAAGEIPVGGRKIVEVDGRSIGVFRLGDGYVALRNTCPHEGAPLCQGVLSGALTSPRPGVYRYARRGEILRCPWHQWEFDTRTGRSWVDPERVRVRSYVVTSDGEHVVLHL